jgi:hypothetical protein
MHCRAWPIARFCCGTVTRMMWCRLRNLPPAAGAKEEGLDGNLTCLWERRPPPHYASGAGCHGRVFPPAPLNAQHFDALIFQLLEDLGGFCR